MSDTRSIDQIVWIENNSWYGTTVVWKPLKITRVLAQYVECSNGKSYNLKDGHTVGAERGYKSSMWDCSPTITTDDKTADYNAYRKQKARHKTIDTVKGHADQLTDEQLDRVLAIIQENELPSE
jgi:hypothetical protein